MCVADFAFVTKSLTTGNLKVIGSIARSVGAHIIARPDSGIAMPADLVGKTVAVPKGTIAEFFLGAYCQRNGVPYGSLRVTYMSPTEIVEALKKGTVNAACIWSPFMDHIRDYLGKNAVLLPSQGRTDYYLLLVTRTDILRDKSAVIERLLKTMIEVETFVRQHSDEAMQMIAKKTGLTIAQIRGG